MNIALITPALKDANNGNWQTAQRWATMLGTVHSVELAKTVNDLQHDWPSYDAMIALHARRSAASVAAFAATCPAAPLWVVLTGTDLYRDIVSDTDAQRSLQLASNLVVLQEHGVFDLPAEYRHKAVTVFQSAPRRAHQAHSGHALQVCVVGHLRSEKSPETVFAVAQQLAHANSHIYISHIGQSLDQTFAQLAAQCQTRYPNHYRWLGGLSHADSLAKIAQSDVLLHPSVMEGGALAIIEAVQSGTAVIASRVAGHVGLLGAEYAGFFEWNNALAATALLQRFAADTGYAGQLRSQCAERSRFFDPATEQQTLLKLLTI